MSVVNGPWPLPERPFVPGWHPHPERGGDQRWCERVANLDAQVAYVNGWRAYGAGFFWEAHVFWEIVWRAEPGEQAAHYWAKGLIQLSAACLHLKRGKGRSFQRIGRRGLDTCLTVAHQGSWGFDQHLFLSQWQRFISELAWSPSQRPRYQTLPSGYAC